MRFLERVSVGLDRFVAGLSLAAAWLALPLLVIVSVFHVVGRQFRDVGSESLYELGSALFFALVMFSLGYAYLRDGHVRVDVVRERLPARWIAWIELAGCLLVLVPLSSVLIAYGAGAAWGAFVRGERAEALDWLAPWAVKAAVPLGFLLLLLAGVSVTIRNALFLSGRARSPAPRSDA